MSRLEQTWPMDALDAISILIPETRLEIQPSTGELVTLEGNIDERDERQDFQIEIADRWLQIHQWERPRGTHLTLHLPQQKAWVIDLSTWSGDIHIQGIQTRLQAKIGKGEIRVEHCQGLFDLVAGQGNISLEHCQEKETPERPPRAPEVEAAAQAPEPDWSRRGGEFRRPRRSPWEWGDWNEQDWTRWGLDLAQQATSWAGWLSRFFSGLDWKPGHGVYLQSGKGDLHIQEVRAETCNLWIGKGNVKLQRGLVATLGVYAGRGDIDCESILPAGNWDLKTSHGDIQLSLPSNTQAKLDVATRRGDIRSEIPLVRVGRPGPESRHGSRMVGTIGPVESRTGPGPDPRARVRMRAGPWMMMDKEFCINWPPETGNLAAQISLATVNGDIRIEVEPATNTQAASPARPAQPAATAAESGAKMTEPSATVATASAAPAAFTQAVTGAPPPSTETPAFGRQPEATTMQPAEDPQVAILQALSRGEITVPEAERRLQELVS